MYGDIYEDYQEEINFVISGSYITYKLGDNCHVPLIEIHFESGTVLSLDDPDILKGFESNYLSEKLTDCEEAKNEKWLLPNIVE